MSSNNHHINYSAEDIERYLNGGMSPREMHDMEKAALQDPFLADAIEGYRDAPMQLSHRHLNEIAAALQQENTAARVIEMPARNRQWWKIAAMIIVIPGAGILSWFIAGLNNPSGNTAPEVAALKEKVPSATDTQQSLASNDSAAYIAEQKPTTEKNTPEKILQKNTVSAAEELADRSRQPAATLVFDTVASNALIAGKIDSLPDMAAIAAAPGARAYQPDAATVFTPIPSDKSRNFTNSQTLNSFPGIVKDDNNQPVANAVIKAATQRSAVTDERGYFNILSPDSTLKVSVSSVGYSTANVSLAKGETSNIIIEPDRVSLSEMVVTGYNSKKSESKGEYGDSTFPSGGWQSFQEYVYRKMNRPYDSANNQIITPYGSVEIEFSIDEAGNPYNFNVLKSSGKENDEKAIKTIKDGPRWITSKKERKGKVKIQL